MEITQRGLSPELGAAAATAARAAIVEDAALFWALVFCVPLVTGRGAAFDCPGW